MHSDLKSKKNIVINYIQKNPNATYQEIKKNTKLKVERLFSECMKGAYKAAGIPFSKSLSKRGKNKMIYDVITFIRKHPGCTVTEVQNATKVSIPKVFGSITNAYKKAGVEYPRFSKLEEAYKFFRKSPLSSSVEIQKRFGINIYKHSKNMEEFCNKAGVKYIGGHKKRLIKSKRNVVDYIKSHPDSTQWEINKNCKTHVQEIFKGGIKEAYKKAEIKYPEKARKNYGVMNKEIKKRAQDYENRMINILKIKFNFIKKQLRTKSGIADALIKIRDVNYVVEIKDYRSKPISISQINQLNRYINEIDNCNNGLLICNFKPKKDKFYIGNNKISIITEKDLLKGGVV
ncbi:MAG: hypothetical protein ABIJ20_00135 [Nanoarchaeota archaeon]|nr:hypothetical protein [Nanoarchaeota archaeon]MBU1445124.1 hypothetical protein [Nanoarchaeota archaeon]MBU2420090.1 hypothetical protein [Nanoarchaeota archaeon]MBU2475551.1 hypothetical protein [Nanoarchaeota archaeon]